MVTRNVVTLNTYQVPEIPIEQGTLIFFSSSTVTLQISGEEGHLFLLGVDESLFRELAWGFFFTVYSRFNFNH